MTPTHTSLSLRLTLCLLLLCGMSLSGCVSAFDAHRQQLEALYAQGRFDVAAQELDQPQTQDLYGEKNELLLWLDRGSVALYRHNHPLTIEELERAEGYMEVRREPTTADDLAKWLINDTAAPYYGSAYEDMYVNVFKLLAQLENGTISGGATVEARRLAGKADVLRERYLRTRDLLANKASDPIFRSQVAQNADGRGDVNDAGEFVESTLGTFLTAVTFMKDGDLQDQAVAGRRLISSIQLQRTLQPGVSTASFKRVGTLKPSSVNVLVVGLSGRGPTKRAVRIGPIPAYEWPIYFELPELVGGSEEVALARVAVDSESGPWSGNLAKVEDMRAVAMENFRREQPLIYARTLLRSSAKAAGMMVATEAAKDSTSGSNRDLVQIGMILGGLAAVTLTEKADLRCWTFLPARADAGLLKLTPGTHRVRIEFYGAGGGLLYAGPWHEIAVPEDPNALVTVIDEFWR